MKFYFTWASDQKYLGKSMANHYTIIEANDSDEARQKMFARFGTEWGFQYKSAEEAGVDEYKLIHFPFTQEKYEPCGGCGNDNPQNVCIGCFHSFKKMVN